MIKKNKQKKLQKWISSHKNKHDYEVSKTLTMTQALKATIYFQKHVCNYKLQIIIEPHGQLIHVPIFLKPSYLETAFFANYPKQSYSAKFI